MITITDKRIEKYCTEHTTPEGQELVEIENYTKANRDDSRMISGRLTGQLLRILISLANAKNILEIGTFTGYSAVMMSQELPPDGKIISCELDKRTAHLAQELINKTQHASKIEIKIGPALDTIATLTESFDLIFVDADKERYPQYFEAVLPILKKNGLIIFDNALWDGLVLNPKNITDIGIHNANTKIINDSRVRNVLIPVRDGLNIVQKL